MPEIEAGVLAFVKREYPSFRFGVLPPRLRLPFVSVDKARRPLFGIGLFESVHVLLADPEFAIDQNASPLPSFRDLSFAKSSKMKMDPL